MLYFSSPTMTSSPFRLACACLLLSSIAMAEAPATAVGTFTGRTDVGTVSRPGTATFDAAAGAYTIGASGANMWFTDDAMTYVWKKVSGDGSIAADVGFVGTSTQGHRKACLVIRQNLDPGSPYVDVAVHGDGLTSLQFRATEGGTTKEIQSNMASPQRVRLDKIGDTVYLSVAHAGEQPHPSGCSFQLHFANPFYIGLAVSAHDNAAFETAVFSKVEIGAAAPSAAVMPDGLTIVTLPSGDRRVSDH
jgi:TolB protein